MAKSREGEYRYIKSAYLSPPVDNALAQLITKELEYQRVVDDIKRDLNARFDFNLRRCFGTIDKAYPYNTIDRNEIRDFVREYFVTLNEDELDAIIRRCDTDEDELISESEFNEVVKHKIVSPITVKFFGKYYRPIERKYTRRELTEWSPKTKYWRSFYDRWWDDRYSRCFRRYSPQNRDLRQFSPIKHEVRVSSPVIKRVNTTVIPVSNTLINDRATLRRTLFDPTIRSLRTANVQRQKRKATTSPKKMSDTVTQETVSSFIKRKAEWKSPSRLKDKLSGCSYWSPISRMPFSEPVRSKPIETSPTRVSLKTRFDAAADTVEEVKIASPTKSDFGSFTRSLLKTAYTISPKEEDELALSLKELIDLDKEIERAKQALALRQDFTLYDGFRVFDYDNNGNANINDIVEAFETFGVHLTSEEANLFLIRYDLDKDGTLDFKEIWEAFTPKEQKTAQSLKNRSTKYPNGYYTRMDEFSTFTQEWFVKVLKLHIEVELRAEAVRQNHKYGLNYRYEDAFTTINNLGGDFITRDKFASFFKRFGFYATDLELDILVSRFDKNYDGKVSYQEFYEELTPHSPLKI